MTPEGYITLTIEALLPAAVTVIIYAICHKKNIIPERINPIIPGILFGSIAVFSTEFGVPIEGAVLNCRDAAVLCAGLFFGGPAGIIAGLIGGIERWFASYWGAGEFTQLACSLSCIIAGLFAAVQKTFALKGKRPSWAFAFVTGIVMESVHMLLVFATNLDQLSAALAVVRTAAPPMIFLNAVSLMAAAAIVSLATKERRTLDKTSILYMFQDVLLICFLIVFIIMSFFIYYGLTSVQLNQTSNLLKVAVSDTIEDVAISKTMQTSIVSSTHHVGQSGFTLVASKDGIIISGPAESVGHTPEEIGISISWETLAKQGDYTSKEIPNETNINGEIYYWIGTIDEDYGVVALIPQNEALSARDSASVLCSLSLILMFAIAFSIVNILLSQFEIRRISYVNKKLKEIEDGNLDTIVDVRTSKEFAELSDGINSTVTALKKYIDAEAARIDEDLAMAKDIQLGILPRVFPPFPGRTDFDIYANITTAKEVGGDFYDFYLASAHEIVFGIADVSGKGIPAAMYMMRAKTLLKSAVGTRDPLASSIARTNNMLCQENEKGMFVTAWTGVCDLDTGILTYVNAGHNPPLVRLGSTGTFEYLSTAPNMVLGAIDGIPYKAHHLQLPTGSQIFFYTDGVTEAVNSQNELFGEDRLKAIVNSEEFAQSTHPQQCALIERSIKEFADGEPQFDDITLMTFVYHGKEEADHLHEIHTEANIENIEKVTEFINNQLETVDCPKKIMMQIDIAIDELFGNIAQYAYDAPNGPVLIRTKLSENPKKITIIFIDNGTPYNPLLAEQPDTSLSVEEKQVSSLGIFIAKKTMDEMEYKHREGQNILIVEKVLV